MDRKSLLCVAATALFVGFSGCEKHSWEETQKLHQPHHGGEHHDGDSHHEGDAGLHEEKAADHGKAETHGEAKAAQPDAAHPAEPKAAPAEAKGEARNLGVE
jgi:hypothetical protein